MNWLPILASLAISGTTSTQDRDADLKGAFDAAFPERSITAVIPAHPWGSDSSRGEAQEVRLTIKPDRLIALDGDRFALVALESDELGYHAEPGALSVAYVEKTPSGWSVEKVWRELAWTGNTGRPAEVVMTARYGRNHLVFFSSDYVGQGQHSTTDYVVTLGQMSPIFDGYFPGGGSLGQDGCSVCDHYAYASSLHLPHHYSDLFSVSYRGWTSSKAKVQQSHRFSAHTEYRSSSHGLVAIPPVKLPD